jgi:hypothetical protein
MRREAPTDIDAYLASTLGYPRRPGPIPGGATLPPAGLTSPARRPEAGTFVPNGPSAEAVRRLTGRPPG